MDSKHDICNFTSFFLSVHFNYMFGSPRTRPTSDFIMYIQYIIVYISQN